MSKDNAEGGNGQQREITAVAGNDNAKDEDIQDFAEHTVNELLAWYGYGDRENDQLRRRHHHHHHRRRHHDDAHSRCHDDDDDNVCVRHRDSTSDVTDLVPDLLVRPNSGCEILKRAHQRREVNADNEFMESSHSPPPPTTTTHVANLKSQSFETEYLLEQRPEVSPPPPTTTTNTTTITTTTTTTTTSMSRKLCDWCQQKPPNVDFSDSVDGLNPLSFCSERCLNRYKMNLFCTETRQYLQQIHSSEDSSCDVTSAIASDNSRILITPDLWMSDEKQQGGSDVTPPAEVTASIVVDDDDDDDNLRHSGASERHDDVRHRRRRGVTSSNVSVTHFGEWKRNKRRKEEEEEERTKVGEGGEGGEGGNRMTSSPGDRVAMVTGDDDDVFDSECESVGRGRRLQRDSIPGHSNRLGKTFGVNPEVISTPSSSSTTSSSSYSAVEGSITFASDGGAIGLDCCGGGGGDKIKDRFESLRRAEFRHPQSSTSNLHNDHTVFRRLGGEGLNLGETSRGENPFGSWQDKTAVPPFNSTTFFAPGASLPGNPLFSVPTMPSVMHLLGPTLNPQFLGCGSSTPLPVFGIPPPNPIPGAEGGVGGAGPHIAAGVPVAPLQAAANPWSCLLPPGTLMVPYPFLLPLPIPIPIPFPLPVKSEENAESTECVVVGSGERKTRKSEEAVPESTVGDLRSSAESLEKHIRNLPKVVVDRFPAPKIVCSCCRKDSSSCVSESWATAAAAAAQPRDPPHPKTFFCTASLPADFEPLRSSDPIGDASGALLSSQTPNDDDDDDDDDDYDDDNNHILDFSMSRNQKSTPNRSSSFLRTPPHIGVGGSTAPLPSPTVSVKSEPLDLAAYSSAAENSFRPPPQPPPLPSSSSPGFKRTVVGPAAVASGSLHSFPALPYLARRSLILDAPSILGERPQHVKKNMVETSSSKRFAYCKRRHSNVHVKTK